MQYSIAVYLPLFAGLANAGKIAFLPGTQSAVCGFNGGFCDQPTCYAEVVDVHGCSGQTDMWGGDCIGGPSTLSESICGSAEIIINNCHPDKHCVDFHNAAGDTARFICTGGPNGDGCGDSESGTCADVGLGKC